MFGSWWTPIRLKERLQELKGQKVAYRAEIRNLEKLLKLTEATNYPRWKIEVHNNIIKNQYHLEICKEFMETFQEHLGINTNVLVPTCALVSSAIPIIIVSKWICLYCAF